jgi:hypothetical protein
MDTHLSGNFVYDFPCFTIGLCDKWSESKYGTTSRESSNLKLINFMETKYLVHITFDTIDEWNEYIRTNREFLIHEEKSFRYLLMKSEYRFADRFFAYRHYGIVKFQRLWRMYYANKLKRYKNVRYLMMRQITGKRFN